MGGTFSRNKGQRAEREAAAILQPVVTKIYAEAGLEVPQLKRNLMQTQDGGHDIAGLEWLSLEIKHQENFQIGDWWEQTKRQAGTTRVPVLMYKKNNVKWRVRMFGYLPAGEEKIKCPVDVSLESFLVYFEQRVRHSLK